MTSGAALSLKPHLCCQAAEERLLGDSTSLIGDLKAPVLNGARPSNPKWLLQRPLGMVPRIYGCHTAHYRLVCAIEEKPITLKRVFSMELGNVTFPLVR